MNATRAITPATKEYWRIVLALAAKDIVDALKNKTTLTLLLGLGLMMLTVQALPLLLKLDDRPRIAIYDGSRTSLADELRDGGDVRVLEMRTAEDALAVTREASTPMVSVSLPSGWEGSSGPLVVDGYMANWIGPEAARQLVAQAEQSLGAFTGRPVTIEVQRLYPTLTSRGHTMMVALGLVLATVLTTTILVPYLILEEKTTHTLDVLRTSPASITQVLVGKGLAGMVYGLLAAAVLLAFNVALVNLWGLMVVTILAVVMFGVALGLLVGTLVENEGAVQMWVALLVVLLMFPLMLTFFNSNRLPAWVQEATAWLPTTAAFQLARISFGNILPLAQVLPRLAVILVAVVVVFAATGWRLRRLEA